MQPCTHLLSAPQPPPPVLPLLPLPPDPLWFPLPPDPLEAPVPPSPSSSTEPPQALAPIIRTNEKNPRTSDFRVRIGSPLCHSGAVPACFSGIQGRSVPARR